MYASQTGSTVDDINKELQEQAEKNVRVGLALGKVIQLEKIENKEKGSQMALDRLIEIATKK
jgi:FKBP-type peptidyl-prolyl cis-trans isomerase (trigger factor)